MRNERFKTGDFSTKFLEEEYPKGFKGSKLDENELSELASAVYIMDYVKKAHNGEKEPAYYDFEDEEINSELMEGEDPYLLSGESYVNLVGESGT